jgi:hypothetical protein
MNSEEEGKSVVLRLDDMDTTACAVCGSTTATLKLCNVGSKSYACCDGYEPSGGSHCVYYAIYLPHLEPTNTLYAQNSRRNLCEYMRTLCLANNMRLADQSGYMFMELTLQRRDSLRMALKQMLEDYYFGGGYDSLVTRLAERNASLLPSALGSSGISNIAIEKLYSQFAKINQTSVVGKSTLISIRAFARLLHINDELLYLPRDVTFGWANSVSEFQGLKQTLVRQWPYVAKCQMFYRAQGDIFGEIMEMEKMRQHLIAELFSTQSFCSTVDQISDRMWNEADTVKSEDVVIDDDGDTKMDETDETSSSTSTTSVSTSSMVVDNPHDPQPSVDDALFKGKQPKLIESDYSGMEVVRDESILTRLGITAKLVRTGTCICVNKKKQKNAQTTITRDQAFMAAFAKYPIVHSHINLKYGNKENGLRVCWIIADATNTSMSAKAAPLANTVSDRNAPIKTFALFVLENVRVNKGLVVTGTAKKSGRIPETLGSLMMVMARRPGQEWRVLNQELNSNKKMYVQDEKRGSVRNLKGLLPHNLRNNKVSFNNGKERILNALKEYHKNRAFLIGSNSHTLIVPTFYCERQYLMKKERSVLHDVYARPTLTGHVEGDNFILDPQTESSEVLLCNIFFRYPIDKGRIFFTSSAMIPNIIKKVYYFTFDSADPRKTCMRRLKVIHPTQTITTS